MKKIMIAFALMLVLIITGCADDSSAPSNEEGEESSVNYVTTQSVIDKVESGDTYAFILGNNTCPACLAFKENLKDLEGYTFDYIDLLVEENMASAEELLSDVLEFDTEEGVMTPTTFFVKDGEIQDYVIGALSAEDLMNEYGDYIEELKEQ